MRTETLANSKFQPIEISEAANYSITKGLELKFRVNHDIITFRGSLFTGREAVLINNQPVSRKWSFKRQTKHKFQHNGEDYELYFKVTSLLKYTWVCSLHKNDTLLNEIECKSILSEQSFLVKHSDGIAGGIVGVTFALGYISLTAVFSIGMIWTLFSIWNSSRFLHIKET